MFPFPTLLSSLPWYVCAPSPASQQILKLSSSKLNIITRLNNVEIIAYSSIDFLRRVLRFSLTRRRHFVWVDENSRLAGYGDGSAVKRKEKDKKMLEKENRYRNYSRAENIFYSK